MAGIQLNPSSTDETMSSDSIYTIGVVLATASLAVLILNIPPLCWHIRNRNIGASFFVGWAILLLLFNFVNAIIWDGADPTDWFDGQGLCDIEVKLQLASSVGLPSAFACVLRALAAVLDTERASLVPTAAQRRRRTAIDLLVCAGVPLLQIPLAYVVQPNRYYIFGIAGCVPSIDNSWLALILVLLPPVFPLAIDAYYAILILIRLYRYRRHFNSILAGNDTNKSRFMRLYFICIVWMMTSMAVWSYEMWWNSRRSTAGFDWAATHDAAAWQRILKVPSHGIITYDRWLWLVLGLLVFAFFGFGKEAKDMYRVGLLALGLGRVFPSLRPRPYSRRGGSGGPASGVGSVVEKARSVLTRKPPSGASFALVTTTSSSMSEPLSPTKPALQTAAHERSDHDSDLGRSRFGSSRTNDAPNSHPTVPLRMTSRNSAGSALQRLRSLLGHNDVTRRATASADDLPLAYLGGGPMAVRSDVSTGLPVLDEENGCPEAVLVRTEVTLGSEAAESMESQGWGVSQTGFTHV